jgi:hypothetical protein
LIQLRSGIPEAQDIAEVRQEICALYPPESSVPGFQLTEVVEQDGKKFVRLSTLAGSMHFMLRRGVKLKSFPRVLLCTKDKEVGDYEYFS